jgi:hypothetical protein
MALCPKCKEQEISQEDKEMSRKLDDVQVCGDCYFQAASEVVEKFPPVNPSIVRGK